jgi:hypothetical protein
MPNLFQKLQSALSLHASETGDIQAHRPLSPKMEAFLAKHNPVLLEQCKLKMLVNVDFSYIMAFAILHYFNIRITRLKSGQELLFVLAIIMAISITVATKQAITVWVIRTRSGETERSFPQNIAFSERLQTGDTLSYVLIIIPIMEMLFAGPGLMELLPSSLANNLFDQVSAFVVAGLTATVNIFLAWSQGLEKIQELRQHQAQWVEYQANKADYEQAKHDRDTDPNYLRCLQRFKVQALIAVQFGRTRAKGQQWWDSFEHCGKRHRRLVELL